MSPEDIDAPHGVRHVYEASMIPAELIAAIRDGKLPQYLSEAERSGQRLTGMLHEFDVRPAKRKHPRHLGVSVHDQILCDLTETMELGSAPSDRIGCRGKCAAHYKGAILIPREGAVLPEEERNVLAWATWWESRIANPSARRRGNDRHVEQVQDLLRDENITFESGVPSVRLRSMARRTILLDTINASPEAPGAAALLFLGLCREWLRKKYEMLVCFRYKNLQIWDINTRMRDRGGEIPRWDNVYSQRFFFERMIQDIGTRLSRLLAPREVPRGKEAELVFILPTEGYMAGRLEEVVPRCEAIDEQLREKFAA
jgi:hypothetical protein